MKKQLIIIGLITLLICVGLSGCNENPLSGDLSPYKIRTHTDKYLGKTVTVKGYYKGGNLIFSTLDYNDPTIGEYIQVILPDGVVCYDSSLYRFTGVVFVNNGLAGINATKVEAI